jgi:hypothetical protein
LRGQHGFATINPSGIGDGIWIWRDGRGEKVIGLNDGPYSTLACAPIINNAGEVAFWGRLTSGAEGIFLSLPNQKVIPVVSSQDGLVGLDCSPALANSGTVAFIGQSAITGVQGVFVADQGGVELVADSTGPFSSFSGGVTINSAGAVTFHANQDAGPSVIFVANAPSGDIEVANNGGAYQDVSRPTVNAAGMVAF